MDIHFFIVHDYCNTHARLRRAAVAMVMWALNGNLNMMSAMDVDSITLAERFHNLQLKQKERFKARVTKLQAKSIDAAIISDPDVHVLSDDLGLVTASQERNNGRLTPANKKPSSNNVPQKTATDTVLQETVQKQVEQLILEKAKLTSQLKSTEKKVASLQRTLEEEREALGESVVTTQKVVELSKKNRLLHAELAVERNRSRQLEREMKAVTDKQQVPPPPLVHEQQEEEESVQSSLKSQLNSLQEQLVTSRHKTTEYRNQYQLLKQDLKLAHRVIAKEVGKGASVSTLLNSQSGWRGRSQQIITLQNKLLEMKILLEKTPGGRTTDTTRSAGACGSGREGGGRIEARQRATLDKMERERRENLEVMKDQLERAQRECARLHKECNALRARNKTLTEETKSLRSKPTPNRTSRVQSTESNRLLESRATVCVLETRTDELEKTNQELQQQLRDCEKELQASRQSCSRLSTRAEALSLPSLIQHTPRHYTRTHIIRGALSANQTPVVLREAASLQEAQLMARLAETERDRLLDLTTTLQKRLASTTDQLVRLKTDRSSSLHRAQNYGRVSSTVAKKPSLAADSGKIEALEVEVAIQRDENTVLKETLSQLRQERLEDVRVLHDMLQETRRMCTDMRRSDNKS